MDFATQERAVSGSKIAVALDSQELAPKPFHYSDCGIANVYVLNGFELQTIDGQEFVSFRNYDGLRTALGLNPIRASGPDEPATPVKWSVVLHR